MIMAVVLALLGLQAQGKPLGNFQSMSVSDKNGADVDVILHKTDTNSSSNTLNNSTNNKIGHPETLPVPERFSLYPSMPQNNDQDTNTESTLDRSERLIKAVFAQALRKITKGEILKYGMFQKLS